MDREEDQGGIPPHDGGGGTDPAGEDGGGASRESSVIEPGAHIAGLQLIRLLGQGAQGVVFEARQESMNRIVAVKVLPRDIDRTGLKIERFKREASAAGRLNHSNIVAVHQILEDGGHHFIVQELVRGGSLDEKLEDRESSGTKTDVTHCRWAAEIGSKVADALHHAHGEHVVHRDIKPSNIMLTLEGEPKVTDFGLAKVQDEAGLSQSTGILGTPHYMAPEQVDRSRGKPDGRTDVYGLGATLYHMLAGRTPFQATSPNGLFIDILTRAPPPLRRFQKGVSRDLEAVCLKAMEKRQQDRYASCAELRDDLERYLNGEPTKARPVGPIGSATRAVRRLATSALVVLALLIPALWVLVDVLWLRESAKSDVDLHHVRYAALGSATAILGWSMSVLFDRISAGKGWTAWLAWIAALGLSSIAMPRIIEEHQVQKMAAEYTAAAADVLQKRNVAKLEGFIETWRPRFRAIDRLNIAILLTKVDRPDQARDEIDALVAHFEAHGILTWRSALAFRWAVKESLLADTDEDRRSWLDAEPVDWMDQKLAGDILALFGHHQLAAREYDRAADQRGDDTWEISLPMLRVSNALCAWDESKNHLHDLERFMRSHDKGWEALVEALDFAIRVGDWEAAERHLESLDLVSRDDFSAASYLDARFRVAEARDGFDVARQVLQGAVDAVDQDPAVIHVCAYRMYTHQTNDYLEKLETLFLSQDLYSLLLNDDEWRFKALLGLAAVKIRLGQYKAALEQVDGVDLGEFAIEAGQYELARHYATQAQKKDPFYFEGHFQLGLAILNPALRDHGSEDALPDDVLREIIDLWEDAVRLNGLNTDLLNNLANALRLRASNAKDLDAIERARSFANRAQRLLDPSRSGNRCDATSTQRRKMSSVFDTLSKIDRAEYALRDKGCALLASAEGYARLALDVLDDASQDPTDIRLVKSRQLSLDEVQGLLERCR